MAEAKQGLAAGTAPGARQRPLVEMTLARVREFIRQPEAIFWSFGFPVMLALALGIAFRNSGPDKIPVVVEGGGPAAEAAAAALSRSADLVATVLAPAEASQALRTGRVAIVVRAPEGVAGGAAPPAFDYRYDPTRPESRVARLMVDDALQRAAGRADVTRGRDVEVSEPGARYIDFLIPGLIGINLMGSGMWSLGFSVVEARRRKLLKRLAATPMRRSDFLLSFMLSRLIFLIIEVAAVLGFARLFFSVRVSGSWVELGLLALIGALTFAGLGLLVAARTQTIEGVSGLMNLVMLPMWLLSGTFFSAARFPEVVQPLVKALPLTALNDSLRAVINDGTPLAADWAPLLVLLAWGLGSFGLALRLFRWQ